MRKLILCTLAGALLWGCGGGSKIDLSAGRGGVDAGSAKALAVSYDQAVRAREYGGVVECVAPDYRKSFSSVLVANIKYTRKLEQTADMVQKRIGKAPADRLRREAQETYLKLLPSPLEGAVSDGKIAWTRVTFTEKDQVVAVKVDGNYTRFNEDFWLRPIGDRWYVAPHGLPEEFAKTAKGMVRAHNEMMKILGKKQKLIKSGKINAGNVDDHFWPGKDHGRAYGPLAPSVASSGPGISSEQ